MTTKLTDEEIETMTVEELNAHNAKERGNQTIADLRAFANYLEEHPGVAARLNLPRFYAFSYTEDGWKELLNDMGSFTKGSDDYSLTAERKFGKLSFHASISHSEVCERKVVGTRTIVKEVYPEHIIPEKITSEEDVVEWICPDSWKK